MGRNTTVMIMNDYVDRIREYKDEFVDRLIQMLGSGETGEVIPGVKIIESHHSSQEVLVKIGYNSGSVYHEVEQKPKRRNH